MIVCGDLCQLGVAEGSRLSFSSATSDTPNGKRFNPRQLHLDAAPAYELSFWCGTCSFLFERLNGATETLSLDALGDRLNDGVDGLPLDVLDAFGALLPSAQYLPMLLALRPRLVAPGDEEDYFSHEQLDTWTNDWFWGLPNYPHTPYYRSFETSVPGGTVQRSGVTDGHLFEFVVPMVPPSWNDQSRVTDYRRRLKDSSRPTAVALSLLDVCLPATLQRAEDGYYAHWGLTHFLLDGHHKMQAAAEARLTIQLLALVSVDHSLAGRDDVQRLRELRDQPEQRRSPR